MAKSDLYILLSPGSKVLLNPEWARIHKFTLGKIVRRISSIEQTTQDGGTYTIQPHPSESSADHDLWPDLHRSCFKPLNRAARRKSKRKESHARPA